MPRKDGTPTAAERKNAERLESNRRWIAAANDADLAKLATNTHEYLLLDDDTQAMVRAEIAHRGES
jgi:hypothetical protein